MWENPNQRNIHTAASLKVCSQQYYVNVMELTIAATISRFHPTFVSTGKELTVNTDSN